MSGKPVVAAEECSALGMSGERIESFANSDVRLGDLAVSRALPVRNRRLVGPWCFLDRFGPLTFAEGKPMDVAPHPHTGLQTVTWLMEGEILHNDSLGCEAVARAGGVNVMTSGSGIAHTEQTPKEHSGVLNGVQLWVALPDAARGVNPFFEAIPEAPAAETPGGLVRVFAGGMAGLVSPARHFSELLGADLQVHAGRTLEVDLNPRYEHAVLLLAGDMRAGAEEFSEKRLFYLGRGRSSIAFSSRAGGRLVLIGGPPFEEKILMWWNFVARTPEEIAQARADWENHQRFGEVAAYSGARLKAPELVRFARPNPVSYGVKALLSTCLHPASR